MLRSPLPAFLAACVGLSLLCRHLLGNGFLSSDVLSQYAKLLMMQAAREFRLEYLGFLYPHLSSYINLLVGALPGMPAEIAPHLVGIVATAWLLALAWRDIAAMHGRAWAWLFAALLAVHPLLLWQATAGGYEALGLLAFYGLCRTLLSFSEDPEPFTYLRAGGWLCLFFFVDPRAGFVCIALLPWLGLVIPARALDRSPLAFYLICYAPVVLALLSWMYLNWLFLGDGLDFLRDPGSAFRGGLASAPYLPWLQQQGGQWLSPLAILLAMGVLAFPVLCLLPWAGGRNTRRGGIAAAATVPCAGALATLVLFASQPLEFVGLLLAPLIGVLCFLRPGHRALAAVLMIAALPLGWSVLARQQTPEVQLWVTALQRPVAAPFNHETLLGQWLAHERRPTLIDDRAGYAVIAARGDARGIIVPYDPAFKLALARPVPDVAQIVLADPRSRQGSQDAIARRYPALWESGLPGYQLVHQQGAFRVWRRTE